MAQVFSGADIVGTTLGDAADHPANDIYVAILNAELSTFIGVMPAGAGSAIITFHRRPRLGTLATRARPANSRSTWLKRPNRWRPNWFLSCVRGACLHTTSHPKGSHAH